MLYENHSFAPRYYPSSYGRLLLLQEFKVRWRMTQKKNNKNKVITLELLEQQKVPIRPCPEQQHRAERVRRVRSASMAASPQPRSLAGSQQIPSRFFPRSSGAPRAALRAHAGTCVQETKPSLQKGARDEKVLLAAAPGRVCAAPSAALGTGPLLPRHFSSARNWKPFRGTLSSFDFNTALSF